ncbi:hypothetical protein [Maridesulfovibrio sp.]|uniref:hypothetical protein n=1 Tax=unclassified Maridesulfovibrio TaxID=2794999 RepID=UPI003B004D87
MATGLLSYGSSMFYGAASNAVLGTATRGISGQGFSVGNLGMDTLGGMLGGGFGSTSGSGGGITSLLGGSGGGFTGLLGQGGSLLSNLTGAASGASSGATSGSSASTGGSFLGGSGGGLNSLGLLSQFGQSALSGSQARSEVEYNSQLTEVNNYHLMQQGVYNRRVNYKEARLIKQDAEMKLATLRRELYRREHSLSGYKGVRLDSGSIVDVHEDTIRQAAFDAEIVKYQAEVSSNRLIERGDMSVWSTHSQAVLNYNRTQEQTNDNDSAVSSSLLSQGTSLAGSLLGS